MLNPKITIKVLGGLPNRNTFNKTLKRVGLTQEKFFNRQIKDFIANNKERRSTTPDPETPKPPLVKKK